jgi:hypothetical protein
VFFNTVPCTQEVLRLSRELALRTLQLEMEYAYRALEDEALDVMGFAVNGEPLVFAVNNHDCTPAALPLKNGVGMGNALKVHQEKGTYPSKRHLVCHTKHF